MESWPCEPHIAGGHKLEYTADTREKWHVPRGTCTPSGLSLLALLTGPHRRKWAHTGFRNTSRSKCIILGFKLLRKDYLKILIWPFCTQESKLSLQVSVENRVVIRVRVRIKLGVRIRSGVTVRTRVSNWI